MSDTTFPASPNYFNPKVLERKLRGESDWAKVMQQQQALAEKMIQQERELRLLQKKELQDSLNSMINQKQTFKTKEGQQVRQEEYVQTKEREQDYNDYIKKVKNDKVDFRKAISDEYFQEQLIRDEQNRKKLEEEKRMEQHMIKNALDSLEREKAMKQKQKNDFVSSVNQLLQEREMQKKMEMEKAEQDRREYNYLVNQNTYNLDMKDLNYKLYYEKVMEKNQKRQQVHDQRVTQIQQSKAHQIDRFVEIGIEEARRKAEEEERMRRIQKEEQIKSTKNFLQSKIQERQNEQLREKLSYPEKVEELKKQTKEMNDLNQGFKQLNALQMANYKKTLEDQMKEAEEAKRRREFEMPEHEKRMYQNDANGLLIPGIKNTTNDLMNFPTIKTKTIERMKVESPTSPYPLPQKMAQSSFRENSGNDILTPNQKVSQNYSSVYSPNVWNGEKHIPYNPITNPIPKNIQNPYLLKNLERDSSQRKLKNVLATAADNNLVHV